MDAIFSAVSTLISAPFKALGATRSMDSFLNLPLVSVLLLPSVTSWSTSFNLLFFYLTWSTLLVSNSPLKVEFLGTLIIRGVFYVLPSLLFLGFDCLIPGLAKNIKEHGEDGIAIGEANGGPGRKGIWWRVLVLSVFNLVFATGLQTYIEWTVTDLLHLRSALKITTTLPMPWGIIKNLVCGFLLREAFGYAIHRYVLHNNDSPITKYPASYHNYFFHHLQTPIPFSAHFDHPLPYLLRVFIPTYLPATFLRMHLLTYHLYLALISLEEALVYSNYSALPSGLVLGGMARRTERHLMAPGKGNFSPYGLADFVMGTSVGVDLLEDVVQEADRRGLPEQARKKGDKAKKKAGEVGREVRGEGRKRSTRSSRSSS